MFPEIENQKKRAGFKAVEKIKNGQIIGLGTGSTVYYSILKLSEKVKRGLKVKVIATSKETKALAEELGLEIIDLNDVEKINLTIDGADQVTKEGYMVKGGKGALTREKIVAFYSENYVIVVDETKLVNSLGGKPVPLEILKFGWKKTINFFREKGVKAKLRVKNDEVFVTDNGNYIVDVYFSSIQEPEKLERELNNVPGVIENGIFTKKPNEIYVGRKEGVETIKISPLKFI